MGVCLDTVIANCPTCAGALEVTGKVHDPYPTSQHLSLRCVDCEQPWELTLRLVKGDR